MNKMAYITVELKQDTYIILIIPRAKIIIASTFPKIILLAFVRILVEIIFWTQSPFEVCLIPLTKYGRCGVMFRKHFLSPAFYNSILEK